MYRQAKMVDKGSDRYPAYYTVFRAVVVILTFVLSVVALYFGWKFVTNLEVVKDFLSHFNI